MERRQFLAIFGVLCSLPGCLSDTPGEDRGSTSDTTTEDCWPQFCAGSTVVEVVVSSSFAGEVVLEAGCRDAAIEVRSGETEAIVRQSDAETCDVVLTVDGEAAFDGTVHDYQSLTLKVSSSGEVTKELEEL